MLHPPNSLCGQIKYILLMHVKLMKTVTKWFSQNYKNMPHGSIIKHIYFSGAALRQSTFSKENMVKSRVKIKISSFKW